MGTVTTSLLEIPCLGHDAASESVCAVTSIPHSMTDSNAADMQQLSSMADENDGPKLQLELVRCEREKLQTESCRICTKDLEKLRGKHFCGWENHYVRGLLR